MPHTAAHRLASDTVSGAQNPPSSPEIARSALTAVPSPDTAAAVQESKSPNTRHAYASDWSRFHRWCTTHGHCPLPAAPNVVASYLSEAANTLTADGQRSYATATLSRWATAIGQRHRAAGFTSPSSSEVVRATLSRIRADDAGHGARAPRRAAPLLTSDIVAMVETARRDTVNWASEVLERRDSALLLMGYAGAMQRGELVELVCGDVSLHAEDGIYLYARRRPADGPGHARMLPFTQSAASCPACAAVRWMQVVAAFDAGGRVSLIRLLKSCGAFDQHVCLGPLPRVQARAPYFRSIRKNGNLSGTPLSGASIHGMIRRRAALAGLGASVVSRLGVHSLRAGFITQALHNGADRQSIMRQTGHTAVATIDVYAEQALPGSHNAVTDLGL